MSRWIRSSGRFFLFVPLFLALAPSAAFAACASPTGTAGQIIYNADHAMPQYCDGTNWIGFGGASGGSSPVAYWKLDETSGTTVADSAGGYTGTWQFAATNDPVTGVIGNAAQTGWARTIHTAGPITEIGGASQATLSLWMRRGAAGYGEQVGQGIGFESQEFSIAYAGSDVVFTIPDTVVDGTWAQGAYALNDTQWHMLTLVFDGTQTGDANRLKGYVDGQSVTLTYTGTIGTTIGGTAFDFVIATEGDSDVSYIDDVRVYNRALSATEVSGLYNAAIRGAGPTPIAHWKLDETSGTTAEDSIGTNDGTLTNGPVWQPSGGQIGGAVSVDGTNDYVDISATGFPANNASQTLSAWFKYSATLTNNAALVSLSNSSNSVVSMGFECCVGWLSVTSFGGAQLVTYNSAPSANVWHHMVYTFNGTNHVLYLDGVQVGTSTTAPNTGTPSGVYVGQNGFSNRYFPGLIDDVKIYDRALTAAEVAALYDVTDCHAPAGEAGTILFNADHSVLQYCNGVDWVAVDAGPSTTASYNTTGLAAHWKLDEGSGTTAADSSGNNNTGTLTNGPTWTTGKLAGAVNFDVDG
jgi:hypothetical protein